MDVFLQNLLIIFEQSFDYTPYNFTTKKNNDLELKLYKIYSYTEYMNLTKYKLISCIKFIHPQIAYYVFEKLNYFINDKKMISTISSVSYTQLNSSCKKDLVLEKSSDKYKINNNNVVDNTTKDYYIKEILFGDRILYFRIPYTKCKSSPDPDDNIIGNKYIDPDTWMDIPPYN